MGRKDGQATELFLLSLVNGCAWNQGRGRASPLRGHAWLKALSVLAGETFFRPAHFEACAKGMGRGLA